MTDTEAPGSKPSLLPHEEPLPPRWDLYIAAAFLALGLAIMAGAMAMPTFYDRMQQIYTAPGLVPGVYGAIIALLSLWLALRAVARGGAKKPKAEPRKALEGNSNFRLFLAVLLCMIYCVVLIGRLPFWLATTIFIAGFIVVFEWQAGMAPAARVKSAAQAVAIGFVTGVSVLLLFEKLFLVRLP